MYLILYVVGEFDISTGLPANLEIRENLENGFPFFQSGNFITVPQIGNFVCPVVRLSHLAFHAASPLAKKDFLATRQKLYSAK